MLGTTTYWLYYYNLFSLQDLPGEIDSFTQSVFLSGLSIFDGNANYGFGPDAIALYALISAALLAFFFIVESKLFKNKKNAYLTAPLVASATLLSFGLGSFFTGNFFIRFLNEASPDYLAQLNYANTPYFEITALPWLFSMLIMEIASLFFLLSLLRTVFKKEPYNFQLAGLLILLFAQIVYYFLIPLSLIYLLYSLT